METEENKTCSNERQWDSTCRGCAERGDSWLSPLQGCPAGPGWDKAFSGQAGLTPTSEDRGPNPALSTPLFPLGWGLLRTLVCLCWGARGGSHEGGVLVVTRRC